MKHSILNTRLIIHWLKMAWIILISLIVFYSPSFCFASTEKSVLPNKIRITVFFKEAKPGDTLLLYVSQRYFKSLGSADLKPHAQVINNKGSFVFDIPVKYAAGYWELRKLEYNASPSIKSLPQLVKQFFWEAGDDIVLNVSSNLSGVLIKSICKFYGIGSAKYNLQFKADSILWNSVPFVKANVDPDEELSAKNKSLMKQVANYIDRDNNKISDLAKYLTKVDLFMDQGKAIGLQIERFIKAKDIKLGTKERENLLSRARFIFSGGGVIPIDTNKVYHSGKALSFIWYGIRIESVLKNDKVDSQWMFDQITNRFKGNLRDQLLSYWFQYQRLDGALSEALYRDAVTTVTSPDALKQLKEVEHFYIKKYLKEYILPDANGTMINFSQFKHKVTFIDFWFTGCAACASFFNDVVSKVEERYSNDPRVSFITVSTDKFKEKWLEGLKSGIYTSDKATNLYTDSKGSMHPIIWDNKISYQPVAMLIDSHGVIRFFNTENLYKEVDLINTIEELKLEIK